MNMEMQTGFDVDGVKVQAGKVSDVTASLLVKTAGLTVHGQGPVHEVAGVLEELQYEVERELRKLKKLYPDHFEELVFGHDSGVGPAVIDTREVG